MKLQIRVESFEETHARVMERARRMDRGERLQPERSLTFETVGDMLECLTKERVRLCETAREPRTITALAAALGRNKRAVVRDVKRLAELGLLKVHKEKNPGHGQVTVVETAAEKFELRAEF